MNFNTSALLLALSTLFMAASAFESCSISQHQCFSQCGNKCYQNANSKWCCRV
ncbi:hypothetical protein Vi05172_g7497 [Venturia inaequalis]|nr:hypothetical protein Vi05172_g7497 [Venturia inaequalis]